MSEVVIGRCELRIRRVSGWTWGASPQALLAAATRALPGLIGSRLSAIAERTPHAVVVGAPVHVRIAATARQLAALGSGDAAIDVSALREAIAGEVARAVAEAVDAHGGSRDPEAAGVPAATAAPPAIAATSAAVTRGTPVDVRRTLARWFATEALEPILASLDEPTLAALVRAVITEAPAAASLPDELRLVVERVRTAVGAAASSHDQLRLRVRVAAAVLVRSPDVSPARLRSAIELAAPSPSEVAIASERTNAPSTTSTPVASELPARFEIHTALPFLLLSALHHAGWLASLAALDRDGNAYALGAGLAAKLLAPPERGWARARGDAAVIDAFVGARVETPQLVVAARALAPVLPALDASLRAVLARGRGPAPVVLCRSGGLWRVVDGDGTIVRALGTQLGDVVAHVPDGAHVLVPARAVERELLDQLDYRNLRFITDAPAARGETWRTFQGLERRFQTNDTATPSGKLVAIAARFAATVELADELATFFGERPAIPRGELAAFDATCELAVSAALADLAQRLFPAEPTTPALVIQRFATLDAQVEVANDLVRVGVPIGRRHADLMRAGVFGAFALPWFAGTCELGGT